MADTSQTDSMNVENSKSPEASNGLGEAMEVDEAPSETNLDSEKKVSQPADLSESPSSKGESSKKSLPTPANDSSEDSDDEFKGFPEDEADASRRDLFKEYIEESSETKSKTEDYMKPFKRGWKRELVYRSTTASGEKQGNRTDIYYHSPTGKRFRSSREVAESLTGGDLTIENFSFHKEPLGIGDPEKEIIRDARPMEKAPPAESLTSPSQAKRTPQPNKVKPTKPEQPKVQASSKVSSKSTPVRKATSKSESVSDRDGESLDESDWDMGQKNPREICSVECRLAKGLVPTLQCSSCLCLYHPECVGMLQDRRAANSKTFVCKSCPSAATSSSAASKSNSTAGGASSAADNSNPPPLVPITNSAPTPSRHLYSQQAPPIVGTVTTWLPSSSSIIQVQNSSSTKASTLATTVVTSNLPSATEKPQKLVKYGDKSYILVARHNVINVDQAVVSGSANESSTEQQSNNGILLVPMSVQPPPDSTLSDTTNDKIHGDLTAVVETTNGLSPRSSAVAKHSVKLVQLPPQYSPMNFNFMLNAVTKSMLSIFQYLKVHELLRATQACKNWHFIATHHSLWETVKMKNSKICDFDGFGKTLSKHNTRTLDLRKMIMPETPEATSEMWRKMADTIRTLPRLQQIDFGRCTPSAIEAVAGSCPQLESIVSLSMRGTEINMSLLANCQNLVELKLKSFGGFDVKNITALKQLTKLKTLALTTVKNLEGVENALPEGLENLELGECVKISEKFATAGLAKLSKLRRLRLERGQGSNCPTMALVQTVSELPNLAQLELINFDIKPGFDRNIAKCSNIKVLLIIPTYVTQSATTNHVVMGGVSKLSSSLQYFIWGLTVELLKVTDLFIDQVESGARGGGNAPKKSGTGDSIPILKPISDDRSSGEGASQVDILALPKLQRVLSTLLPQTKIKILKIPFSATWRQTVTDVPA
ncbi:Hypothetical protein NTJ_13756 [Nesidiocoris tenuis]|nr:Hypothetical protein NTJ_13756 [Nesidiocoris tenuis]